MFSLSLIFSHNIVKECFGLSHHFPVNKNILLSKVCLCNTHLFSPKSMQRNEFNCKHEFYTPYALNSQILLFCTHALQQHVFQFCTQTFVLPKSMQKILKIIWHLQVCKLFQIFEQTAKLTPTLRNLQLIYLRSASYLSSWGAFSVRAFHWSYIYPAAQIHLSSSWDEAEKLQ